MCVCVCVCVIPPSILTLTHSLHSFVLSPVKSYGINAGVRIFVCFCVYIDIVRRSSEVRSCGVGSADKATENRAIRLSDT